MLINARFLVDQSTAFEALLNPPPKTKQTMKASGLSIVPTAQLPSICLMLTFKEIKL